MDFLYLLVKSLLLPPGLFVLLMIIGFATRRLFFIILSLVLLYLLSTPYVLGKLIAGLEKYPPLTEAQLKENKAQAIVVLGSGRYHAAPEYGGEDLAGGLWRLRYAAYLSKKTDLPIYATGGSPYSQGEQVSEAELMKKALEQEFKVGPVIVEGKSANTRENAIFTASLLEKAGLKTIYLVSNAWHLPRAVTEFQRVGVDVIPAPTRLYRITNSQPNYRQWLPTSFKRTRIAFHEYLGQIWYEVLNIKKALSNGSQPVAEAAK